MIAMNMYPAAVARAAPAIFSCGTDISIGFSTAFIPTEAVISRRGICAFPIAWNTPNIAEAVIMKNPPRQSIVNAPVHTLTSAARRL